MNGILGKFSFIFIIILLFIQFATNTVAQSNSDQLKVPSVLVIYSANKENVDEQLRLLDLLLGHFAVNIVMKSDLQVERTDFGNAGYLVYYGAKKAKIDQDVLRYIAEFQGKVLAIGENIEQIKPYSTFLSFTNESVYVNEISNIDRTKTILLDSNQPIVSTTTKKENIVFQAWKADYSFPLFIHNGRYYFFSSTSLFQPFLQFAGEGLHLFFDEQHEDSHPAYLRLEDVHPLSDIKLLQEAGNYLYKKNIPYMIALIPVYINPETQTSYHLKDNPEMVKVLRELQSKGATIILHGYTHQYRYLETGEGFEFWDVENNRPVSGPPDEKKMIKSRYEFKTKEEYETYNRSLKNFEINYIKERLEAGTKELVELGLHPFGFEAPHYTMSSQGYEIVSSYYSHILGQVQLSDKSWENMGTSPYITSPNFLKDATLLPETIGFYNKESATTLVDINENIHLQQSIVRDGIISGFYHPYLGIEGLKKMVQLMEVVPNIKWIDLKKENVKVSMPFFQISTDALGKQAVKVTIQSPSKKERLNAFFQGGVLQVILWIIVLVVSSMVVIFLLYTLKMRLNLREQLFEERKVDG